MFVSKVLFSVYYQLLLSVVFETDTIEDMLSIEHTAQFHLGAFTLLKIFVVKVFNVFTTKTKINSVHYGFIVPAEHLQIIN